MDIKSKLLSTSSRLAGAVEVPGIGLLHLRKFSLADLDRITLAAETSDLQALALGIMLGVCDDQGNKVFTDDDLPAILDMPFEQVRPLQAELAKQFTAHTEAKKN